MDTVSSCMSKRILIVLILRFTPSSPGLPPLRLFPPCGVVLCTLHIKYFPWMLVILVSLIFYLCIIMRDSNADGTPECVVTSLGSGLEILGVQAIWVFSVKLVRFLWNRLFPASCPEVDYQHSWGRDLNRWVKNPLEYC